MPNCSLCLRPLGDDPADYLEAPRAVFALHTACVALLEELPDDGGLDAVAPLPWEGAFDPAEHGIGARLDDDVDLVVAALVAESSR